MNNTVPEVRADKNGKLVTRHVKPTPQSKWAASLPAPKQPDYDKLLIEIRGALNVYSESYSLPEHNLVMLAQVVKAHDYSKHPDGVLKMARTMTPKQFTKCSRLLLAHQDTAQEILNRGTFSEVRQDAVMLITGTLRHKFKMNKEQRSSLITGICEMWISEAMQNINYMDEVFPRRSHRETETIAHDDATLKDDLAKLIVDNPDRVDTIVSCVTERRIIDVASITEVMNNSAALSLSDGSL